MNTRLVDGVEDIFEDNEVLIYKINNAYYMFNKFTYELTKLDMAGVNKELEKRNGENKCIVEKNS